MNTGNYVPFSDLNTDYSAFPEKCVASSSIPFVFPHRVIGEMVLMDGGTTWNTNVASAVERCMEVVDNESQIIIDIVLCSSSSLSDIN